MKKTYADICLERSEKASAWPWHIGHVSERGDICELADIDDAEGCLVAEVQWRRDQSFIAYSRQDVPLLSKLLKQAIDKLKELGCSEGFIKGLEFPNGR